MSSYQQLLYHIVFSTKHRKQRLKSVTFRESVLEYMQDTVHYLEGTPVAANGYFDHVHLLVGIPAKIAVSKFIGQLKAHTSKHINESLLTLSKFAWQEGYGAFSVSHSQKQRVQRYIERQQIHHRQETFEEEFLRLLDRHEVEYDRNRVFD